MARVLTFLAVLVIAIYAFAFFVRKTGMFFPDRFPTGRWDTKQWPIEPAEHWITTSDGVRLHAWFFKSNDDKAPLLIWFHGNAGNLTDRADIACELARRGASVFLFDWRGYGKSEGRPSESGLYRDALAAFDYVKTLPECHPEPRQTAKDPPPKHAARSPAGDSSPSARLGMTDIVLYGESLGGPYAAYVAKERKGAHSVIIENSFPSLAALGNAFYKLGWTAPFALRTSHWLNEAGLPVLVMHGTRDQVIPYSLGKQLYDELRVPKEMLTANAGHCEIPTTEGGPYYEAVIKFAH